MMSLEEARTQFPLNSNVTINANGRKLYRSTPRQARVTGYSTVQDIAGNPIVLLHIHYRDEWGRMKKYQVQAAFCEKASA